MPKTYLGILTALSLIIISTVFSSIINSQDRVHWASEIDRVLNLNGLIIFYDMKTNNPFNQKIRKVTKDELSSLFCDYNELLQGRFL